MKISVYNWIKLHRSYSNDMAAAIDAAMRYGIGHLVSDSDFSPTIEQIDKCLAWLEQSDATHDPFDRTLEIFAPTLGTAAEQHADKVRQNHFARMILNDLRSEVMFGQ